jgi:hypothetical protein
LDAVLAVELAAAHAQLVAWVVQSLSPLSPALPGTEYHNQR